MSMCRVFSCVVGRGCLLWPVRSLGRTLLDFALLPSVLQGQICLLLQVFLDFLLLHSRRVQIERREKRFRSHRSHLCIVYKIEFYQITVIISFRGRFFFLTPGKHIFKQVIFQVQTIKVISIFISPSVKLCEVIRFSIRILTQFRNWYLPESPFYKSWRASIFCRTWLVPWQYFEIVIRIMPDNILPKHIKILGTPYNF